MEGVSGIKGGDQVTTTLSKCAQNATRNATRMKWKTFTPDYKTWPCGRIHIICG